MSKVESRNGSLIGRALMFGQEQEEKRVNRFLIT